jgi:Family of unknown function (DUF6338)
VIPSTALGLVVFLAALGPGYAYLRVAERRGVRPERSGLVEGIELAVVGAFATTIALLAVVWAADQGNVVDVYTFTAHPRHYLQDHPLRLLWLVALVLMVGYGLAWCAARTIYFRKGPDIVPGGTAWGDAFNGGTRPYDVTLITVELRDGRRVTGALGGFTTDAGQNRELLLVKPIRVRLPGSTSETDISDSFLIVREGDALAISGRYVEGQPQTRSRWWRQKTN